MSVMGGFVYLLRPTASAAAGAFLSSVLSDESQNHVPSMPRRLTPRQTEILNLLSLGAPMILMGDEVRRTQSGNNNAYCQDNEVSWFDWSLVDQNQDIHEFVRRLIRFRLSLDTVRLDHGMTLEELLKNAKIEWHGTKAGHPDWSDNSHSLAFTVQNLSIGGYSMPYFQNVRQTDQSWSQSVDVGWSNRRLFQLVRSFVRI